MMKTPLGGKSSNDKELNVPLRQSLMLRPPRMGLNL